MKERGDLFTETENHCTGYTLHDDVGEKIGEVEVSASRESVKDAPIFDDNDEITPQFERQISTFFGVASNRMLEMPSTEWVVPFLLICLRERDCYGRDLAQRMIGFGFRVAPPEATYRVLQQMEKERMVVSKSFGLSRRRYSITELGEAYLEYLANVLEQYRAEMDLFSRLYNKHSAGEPRTRRHSSNGEESRKHA